MSNPNTAAFEKRIAVLETENAHLSEALDRADAALAAVVAERDFQYAYIEGLYAELDEAQRAEGEANYQLALRNGTLWRGVLS